ncbi:tetratricopeptide repeat protein [Acidobacteria bacterium AB60]|nr:tetratricopeptide repeat protein [Acidobacteria bacterium AB60]
MGMVRGPGANGLLLSALLGIGGTAHAACSGPAALTVQMRAHPTAENAAKLGGWYTDHGQFDCAAETLREALKSTPKSARLHWLLGMALAEGNHAEDGISELQKAAELTPGEAEPRLLLASVYEKAGRHAEAEAQWRQALRADPKSELGLEGLAANLIAREDYAGAAKLLKNAPRTERLTIKLAQALGLMNDLEDASAVLHEAMQAHPGSAGLADAMTVVLVKQHRYQEAIELLDKRVAAHPGDQEAQVQLLRLLVLSNHMSEARPLAPKLLALRPKDPEVLYLNGIVLRSAGEYAQAKALLERAVALQPDFYNSRYNLGMVLVFLREWASAKEQLEKAIALGATQPEAHFELAKALRGLGETDQAAEEMKKYQQGKKEEETRLEANDAASQGDKELDEGKVQEALTHYREAAEEEPGNASYHYRLAMAMERAGDGGGEREQLEKAVALDPKLAGAQNALGYLMSRGGEVDGAVQHFRMAVEAAPGWTEAWINLAAELAVGSHYAEAREAVGKALELDPANAQAKELRDQLARDPAAGQNHP